MAELGLSTSNSIFRRRINEVGFQGLRPSKKPRLTTAMKKPLLQWAKQFRRWAADDWARVCISDESYMEILGDELHMCTEEPAKNFMKIALHQQSSTLQRSWYEA